MQINLESAESHTIEAYSEVSIQIQSVSYDKSVIVSATEIISNLTINSIQEIDLDYVNLLLRSKPKVVIIGHNQEGQWVSPEILSLLSKQGVGIECMSIGAACRTFNVLLSERRAVIAGFIFKS